MAKRPARDRNRETARKEEKGKPGRANQRLVRDLGRVSKRLEKARSAEAKRLRQLDEAAAEVARLEGQMRRIEAELAAGGGAQKTTPTTTPAIPATPPAAPAAPAASRAPAAPAATAVSRAPSKSASAAGTVAPPALAVPEPAVSAEPEPAESPRESDASAVPAPARDSTASAPRPAKRSRGAQVASLEAELARLDAAGDDVGGTTYDMPEPTAAPGGDAETGEAADADDDDGLVIRLGAGASPMLDTDVSDVAPGGVPDAPVEGTDADGGSDAGWTAGSGLPFRSGRNGSTTPTAGHASEAGSSISPQSGRQEAVEAPDPTARSWPQPREQRARG